MNNSFEQKIVETPDEIRELINNCISSSSSIEQTIDIISCSLITAYVKGCNLGIKHSKKVIENLKNKSITINS